MSICGGLTGTNRLPLPAAASWRFSARKGALCQFLLWLKTITVSTPGKALFLLSHADQRYVTPPSLLSPSWIIPRPQPQSKIGRCGSQGAEWSGGHLPGYSQQQELFRGTHWALHWTLVLHWVLHWILSTGLGTCVALGCSRIRGLVYWSKLLAVVERDLFTSFLFINIDRISEICCRVQGRQKNV